MEAVAVQENPVDGLAPRCGTPRPEAPRTPQGERLRVKAQQHNTTRQVMHQMRRIPCPYEGQRPRSQALSRCLVALLLAGVLWLAGRGQLARADLLHQTEVDENCLMCHGDPDFVGTFEDGELLSLHVDKTVYDRSVHGPAGLNCAACHTDLTRYPHHDAQQICTACHPEEGGVSETEYAPLRAKLSFGDRREMVLAINESCRSCHTHEFEVAVDCAHVRVLEGGNREAPVCVDCHGGHEIARLREQPRNEVSEMCGSCHKAVYSTYRTSVHGAALEADSNPDVPGCTECHGVHSVRGPRERLRRSLAIRPRPRPRAGWGPKQPRPSPGRAG